MKCLFGHKYGKIESDGFQYCSKCGKANKPNKCENGHTWVDETINLYDYTWGWDHENIKKCKQIFQKCSECGERQTTWQE